MPTLLETIGEYEEDLLAIIARQWGIEIEEIPVKKLARHIVDRMSEDIIRDFLKSLPESDTASLKELSAKKGKILWPQFVRNFGDLREMGAARRQREQPDTQPTSLTESLYYKGLIGKAFFDARGGPREFAYIPDEILTFFDQRSEETIFEKCHPVPDNRVQKKWIASDFIVDQATTTLAALRSGVKMEQIKFTRPNIPPDMLITLLQDADLISPTNEISIKQAKSFLEDKRGSAFTSLVKVWQKSKGINELLLVPGIKFEKEPANDPLIPRSLLLDLLKTMPESEWYLLDEFIQAMHENHPDFLRKAGEFDAWFVRDKESENILSGYEYWDSIEGQYLRIMIQGPLHWFGVLSLGKTAKGNLAFGRSVWSEPLLNDTPLDYPTIEIHQFSLEKNGQIQIDRYFPRDIRYQTARFCDWGSQKGSRFDYRITPESLQRMKEQGLTTDQLVSLLQKYARKPLPGNIITALKQWEKNGLEVEINPQVMIRVKSAKIMDALFDSPAKSRILERLNPECALIDRKEIPLIQATFLEMGYFVEIFSIEN